MPELPEVETLARDLRPLLAGRCIVGCDLGFPGMVRHPSPEAFTRLVAGRIEAVDRRGKYLMLGLPAGVLVVHLGMSGHLSVVQPGTPLEPHTHAVFHLEEGAELRYRDPRRFGRLLAGTLAELTGTGKLPPLGPEPLDPGFDGGYLSRRFRSRAAPVKALLLDQSVVAGVGNIYADEACHLARIRPDRPAGKLGQERCRRLAASLRTVLEQGIANRGSSVNSYLDAWGNLGGNQATLKVYGRGGQPCASCGRRLAVARVAGRTTVFCRGCQR